jgi:lipoprotein NlpD
MKARALPSLLLVAAAALAAGCATPDYYEYPPRPPARPIPPGPTPSRQVTYTVRPGDTLYAIATEHGTSVDAIQSANGIGNIIKPGQRLVIPVGTRLSPEPPPTPATTKSAPKPAPARAAPAPGPRGPKAPAASRLSRGKSRAEFWWPCDGRVASRSNWKSRGLVVAAPAGSAVCASAGGKVISTVPAGRSPADGWGNVVVVRHASGKVTWYAHLDRILVKPGAWVRQGQVIGTVGKTGHARQSCVAFRVFDRRERPVDPGSVLP